MPRSFTEDDHRLSAGLVLLLAEGAAGERRGAERLEIAARDPRTQQPLRFRIAPGEIEKDRGRCAHVAEDPIEGLPIGVIQPGHRNRALAVTLADEDQLVRALVGKRLQQNPVDDAEDGCVRADAERERHDGDERDGPAADEHASAILQIVAEGHDRLPAGLDGSHGRNVGPAISRLHDL